MRTSDLLLFWSLETKQELYMSFVSAYILSRGDAQAQDHNLRALDQLAELWELSEETQEEWHRIVAQRLEVIQTFMEEVKNRKRYL